jgi:hypothetical protein
MTALAGGNAEMHVHVKTVCACGIVQAKIPWTIAQVCSCATAKQMPEMTNGGSG